MSILNFFKSATPGGKIAKEDTCPEKSKKRIICFTDGSSLGNGKKTAKSGFAVVFPHYPEYDVGIPLRGINQTNNRAELSGIIKSFEIADIIDPKKEMTLIIYTDSELCINSLSKWIFNWIRKDWKKSDGKPVLNIDLLKIANMLQIERPHVYRHVRAHSKQLDWMSVYNDKADQLAKDAATKQFEIRP